MIPLPIPFFQVPEYHIIGLFEQVSAKLLIFSHVPTAIVAIVFAIFLYKKAKQLSTLYLLFLAVAFFLWSYFDLLAWASPAWNIMFGWSVLNMFEISFAILSYWFLYVFIKGVDVPFLHKCISVAFLLPVFAYTLMSNNLDTFLVPTGEAVENPLIAFYPVAVEVIFAFLIALLSLFEYVKANDGVVKRKILLSGIGTFLFVAVFSFTFLLTNMLIYFNIGTSGEAYNMSVYSLFGMPILTGFLGYLVIKYQAFNLKLLKSVYLIIILTLLLFVNIFI